MHELAAVWTDRDGRTWIAVTAIFYMLLLIPFNYIGGDIFGMPIRPAALLPVPLGILFGPAAAWGLGIANIAGDFFGGSWSPMSIFGFIINFLIPYLSYRLFHRLMRGRNIRGDYPTMVCLIIVSVVVTVACMTLLAACGTVFFNRPFGSKVISYVSNNLFWSTVVGLVFFWLVVDHACRNRFVYGREWAGVEETAGARPPQG